MKRLCLLISLLTILTAARIWADLIIEESIDPGDGIPTEQSVTYVSTNRLATKQGTMGTIFLADRQILWQYDTKQSLYLEFTPAALKGLKAQSDAMVAKAVESIQKQMESANSDQKASLQKAIDQMQQGPEYSFKRLGPDKTINGFTCTPIEVAMNGEAQSRICVARLSALGMTAADMQPFDALQKFYSNLGSLANAGSFAIPGLDRFLGFRSFPVEESDPGSSGMSTTTLKSVKRQSVPSSVFTLPPGLTKQDVLGGN
jgi:hypothetical protein